MRHFWETVIRPCCEAAGVRRIVEIGSKRGENTVNLVNYAVEKDGFVYSVDPAPQFDYGEAFRGKEAYCSFLKTTSINALSKLHDYDAVLIDGNHNYYTVYTELQLVLRNAEPFPLVFLHDVSWPYDRRDLYYDPDTIPPAWLNIYKVSGIDPDTDELSEQGFHRRRRNSVYYSNYHCGVLTAVEDFIRENQSRFRFTQIPIMSGLGILLDTEQAYPEALDSLLRTLTPSEPLMNLMRFSDKCCARTYCRMEQHIEAYQRVRKQAVEASNKLAALRTDMEALQAENERLRQQISEERKKLNDAGARHLAQAEEKAAMIVALRAETEQLRQQRIEGQRQLAVANACPPARAEETAISRGNRITGSRLFSEEALCIAFAVTEAGENASSGDYFTAMELASSLAKRGYKIKYLCRRGPEDWYDVGEDVDVLISMLDAYDLNRMYHVREDLVTVAWARNRFSRWIGNPSIQRYSLVLASGKAACDYMAKATGLKVSLFPIATNANRFRAVMNQPEKPDEKAEYGSDYVFTGSYWDAPREIMDCMEPEALPYRLRIFGRNWEKVPKFAGYTEGFLEYGKMPLVYQYTKIVVDDANHADAQLGAVNSRVFDALAAGRLVLTNGAKGAEETFGGMLPVFRSAREFKALTAFYMEHPADRESLVKRLQKFVLENHTCDIRANTLLRLIAGQRPVDIPPEKKIAIMTPVRKWSEAEAWGDYHFAVAMKKCFEEKGCQAEIRILPEWEKDFDGKYVIVLRGLSAYHPRKEHVNLMWNISHPDEVTPEEYNQYDAVFVSSLIWAEHLKPLLKVPVYPLLQCTDPDVFNGPGYGDGEKRYELLFVGNSRKVFRQILKDLIPTPYDLAVYGNYWHNRIDERYIRGGIIPNHKLGREYHDAAILLNDHWKDMKEKGFISNRIFDGLAAGAFIITDDVAGLSDVLKNCVGVYHNREELAKKVKYYMEHPEKRAEMAARGMALVRKKHTFRARVDEMLRVMEACGSKPSKGF